VVRGKVFGKSGCSMARETLPEVARHGLASLESKVTIPAAATLPEDTIRYSYNG
jgi:hypothetical protein